jgi:hypothetical protein
VTALFCAPGMGLIPKAVPSWAGLPLVMLVAALWAALFPVIAHLSVAPDRGVVAGIGQLCLANVTGAVAGCLFTGFVLMDHLGTRELTVTPTVVGLAVAWVLWSDASARPKFAAAGGLAVLIVAAGGRRIARRSPATRNDSLPSTSLTPALTIGTALRPGSTSSRAPKAYAW